VREYDERTCEAPLRDGSTCLNDQECASGTCDSSVCITLPAAGEACVNGRCADGEFCITDGENAGTCAVPPGENEPCFIGSAGCAEGLGCNADNVCVPGPEVGEACLIPTNLCAEGLACDFTAEGSICAERRGQGEACQSNVCEAGLFCDFSTTTCEPVRAVGTDCPDGGGCADGDECGDLLGGNRCEDVPATAGAPCYESCGNDLACLGLGGVCAPGFCGST
jgi:hypothetical protein